MKGITITENNFPMIIGRLQKFFQHEDFSTWHCWSGGMRKRIANHIELSGDITDDGHFLSEKFSTVQNYYGVKTRVSDNVYAIIFYEEDGIDEDDYNTEAYSLGIGDSILFLGNRIVCRKRTNYFKDTPYLYFCAQILKG